MVNSACRRFSLFDALHNAFVQCFHELTFYTISETLMVCRSMHLRFLIGNIVKQRPSLREQFAFFQAKSCDGSIVTL